MDDNLASADAGQDPEVGGGELRAGIEHDVPGLHVLTGADMLAVAHLLRNSHRQAVVRRRQLDHDHTVGARRDGAWS